MARKKNRKKQSQGFIFPAPFACVIGLVGLVSLSYLWFCGRCDAVGAHIKVLENRKAEIHKQVINEQYKWSNMKSTENIINLIHHFNLNMVWPEQAHVVHLSEHQEDGRVVRVDESPRLASYGGVVMND